MYSFIIETAMALKYTKCSLPAQNPLTLVIFEQNVAIVVDPFDIGEKLSWRCVQLVLNVILNGIQVHRMTNLMAVAWTWNVVKRSLQSPTLYDVYINVNLKLSQTSVTEDTIMLTYVSSNSSSTVWLSKALILVMLKKHPKTVTACMEDC